MTWTVKPNITQAGIAFEFLGSKTDQQGRPLQVAAAFVPFDKPSPDPVPIVDSATIAAAQQVALGQVLATVGDGDGPAVKPSFMQRLLRRTPR